MVVGGFDEIAAHAHRGDAALVVATGGTQFITSATNVQREGRAPARPLPPRRFRSSGSSTLPLPRMVFNTEAQSHKGAEIRYKMQWLFW